MKKIKLITLTSIIIISQGAFSKAIIFGFAGAGTDEATANQPSDYGETYLTKGFNHKTNKKVVHEAIMAAFPECENGEKPKNPIKITGYSWGSNLAYEAAKFFKEYCKEDVDEFIMGDPVSKTAGFIPGIFNKPIPAKKCSSHYQQVGKVKGGPLKTTSGQECENTEVGGCNIKDMFTCHAVAISAYRGKQGGYTSYFSGNYSGNANVTTSYTTTTTTNNGFNLFNSTASSN